MNGQPLQIGDLKPGGHDSITARVQNAIRDIGADPTRPGEVLCPILNPANEASFMHSGVSQERLVYLGVSDLKGLHRGSFRIVSLGMNIACDRYRAE